MRIGGGQHRGRRIEGPEGRDLRPLRNRVRLALFDILAPVLPGAEFLDLFAGTGAVGLEALSRGAKRATFVDSSPRAVRLIRANAERLGCQQRVEILHMDTLKALQQLAQRGRRFDLVFVGAPYGTGLGQKATHALAQFEPLQPGALVVLESFHKERLDPQYGHLTLEQNRVYGETRLSFFRFAPGPHGGYTAPQPEGQE